MEIEVPMTNGINGDVHLEADLVYEASRHRAEVLDNLNKLRKENQFCDAIFVIGRHEIPVHRAVVASSSTFLMELFEKYKNNNEEKEGLMKNMIKLKEMEHESFLYLLDYMYTGRLSIPGPHVKAVYKAAIKLKMADAVRTCSQFLSENLTVANCLGVRKAAVDDDLRKHVDMFIQNNINTVTACKKFYGLPTVKVEIIGAEGDLIDPSNSRHLLELTLNWARENINTQKPRLDDLTEQVNILYLNKDNTLTDCIDIDDERTKEDGEVQDYKCIKKRHVCKQQSNPLKGFETSPKGPLPGNVKVFSINPENPIDPKEWTVVACSQTEKKTFMSLCMLNGDLAVLLIHCRKTANQSPSDSGSEAPDSPTGNPESFERVVSMTPLAPMTSPRCGFGLSVVSGKLFACGGYDRGECMETTEFYDPKTNKWMPAGNMSVHRGRFNIERVNNVVYAVGGSNGQVEQRSVECYNPEKNKWSTVSTVEKAKTSQALISVDGKLYCIGGCVGQISVAECEVFDTETKTWSKIAPLPTARYQIAVSYYQGFIYAIGGTDGWNCLGITEIYDIKTNKWCMGPSLNVNRRGAGCDILNGKLYVVGGSDGSHSLKSTEILETNSFTLGPPMSIGRANVSVVTLDNRLYAVGGFSGKKFLDTFEYLDSKNDEWSGYCPANSNNQSRQEGQSSS